MKTLPAKTLPAPGRYRHYEGRIYILRLLALWAGTDDLWLCVYQDQETGEHFARDADEWFWIVDQEKQTRRFEPI